MQINQNIAAFNAYRNLSTTQDGLSSSLEKLSSGFRINRAADDASGLVNSENLRSQIGGLNVATRNAQDAISLVQTAEGAQTEVHSLLQRMRDLAVQSGNLGTNDDVALQANQQELDELVDELDRIASQTQFGTQTILDGTFGGGADEAVQAVLEGVTGGITGEGAGNDVELDVAAFWADVDAELTAAELEDYSGQVELTFANNADAEQAVTISVARDASSEDIAGALNTAVQQLVDDDEVTWADDLEVSHDFADGGTITLTDGGAGIDFDVSVGAGQGSGAVFQVGANSGQTVEVSINAVSASGLGIDDIDVTTAEGVDAAIVAIDEAIGDVSANRAELGAFQNRMESTIRNVSVAVENLSAAESRIRDTDMALEMVEFTRNQILQQAGTSMLAQANMVPQSVLSLL